MDDELTEEERYIAWSINRQLNLGQSYIKLIFNKLHKGWEERQKEKLNKDRK